MSSHVGLNRFYGLMSDLRVRLSGYRYLASCDSRAGWPRRGVYFFFDEQEPRTSGEGLRVVRVGTHALRPGERTYLWGRLRGHRGRVGGDHPGGGDHRGSVFRKHVGTAMIAREPGRFAEAERTWPIESVSRELKDAEVGLEMEVSSYIGALPLLWVGIDDEPGPDSDRALVERNAIAMLSNHRHPPDPPSAAWVGRWARDEKICDSGLWNVNHVDDPHDSGFLDILAKYVGQADGS